MSRFVSAGAINAETGEAVAAAEGESKAVTSTTGSGDAGQTRKNAEWEAVQKELDAERKRREEARVKAVEGGERSLYDVLQANKGEFPLSPVFFAPHFHSRLFRHDCLFMRFEPRREWRMRLD